MASADFTPEMCELIFVVPKRVISRISWQRANAKDVFIFRAKVLMPTGETLDLTGHWQKNGRHNRTRWGFNLAYLGHCIRSFDMAKYHRNPGGGTVHGPHKHKFSSSKISRLAYTPDPPLDDKDPNRSLLGFLEEAHIEAPNYQFFMFP
jgi:hypothetical protein